MFDTFLGCFFNKIWQMKIIQNNNWKKFHRQKIIKSFNIIVDYLLPLEKKLIN